MAKHRTSEAKINIREIAKQVRANIDKLEKCDKHAFTKDLEPDISMGKRWECEHCGGEVNNMEKIWYERGLLHGKA